MIIGSHITPTPVWAYLFDSPLHKSIRLCARNKTLPITRNRDVFSPRHYTNVNNECSKTGELLVGRVNTSYNVNTLSLCLKEMFKKKILKYVH